MAKVKKQAVRGFRSDSRNNPGMHNPRVGWAHEALGIAQRTVDELHGLSKVGADAMAGALRKAMRSEIEGDSAYFEAAALLFAGLPPPRLRRRHARSTGE